MWLTGFTSRSHNNIIMITMMLAPFNTDHVSLKSSRSLSVATLAMFKAVANNDIVEDPEREFASILNFN